MAQGRRRAEIHDQLVSVFAPAELKVIDESGGHNVPPGSESHFKVVIVSDRFEGVALVRRHRMVHEALAAWLAPGGIHALSIVAYTPQQWQAAGETVPASPPCRGGGRG